MASEKIIEFDENNRYKVKLEVGNIDTSTVKGVAIDDDFGFLEEGDENSIEFWVFESYVKRGGIEHKKWDCEYSFYRKWNVVLEDGELVVKKATIMRNFYLTKKISQKVCLVQTLKIN